VAILLVVGVKARLFFVAAGWWNIHREADPVVLARKALPRQYALCLNFGPK